MIIKPYLCSANKIKQQLKIQIMKKQVLDFIAKDIQAQCMRLGINAQFSTEVSTNRWGDDVFEIKSTQFNTTPMIFKSIYVGSQVWICPVEDHANITKITVRLTYQYNLFDGGSNGTDLGTVEYAINTEDLEKTNVSEESLPWMVRKLHGIEL